MPLPPLPWPPSTTLAEDGLGMDSLERLTVASAVSEALRLHRSGLEDHLLARPTLGDWIAVARAGLEIDDLSLTFLSSGSTGDRRPHEHSIARLQREVSQLATLIGPRRRLVSAVPSHHIYGFIFTILLPMRLGIGVVSAAGPRPGDLVIGHPEYWRAVARRAPSLPEDVVGITSTAPCPPEVIASLNQAGLARLLEIYGSSETAGVGWRDTAEDAFRLFEHWRRAADPRVLTWEPGSEPPLRVIPPDHLDWKDDRRFWPAGRIDGAVQIGGQNVYPVRVARILETHPAVALASVRSMRRHEGNRLKAFIVPRRLPDDPEALKAELFAWASTILPAVERPTSFTLGPALPTGPLGKPADWVINEEGKDIR